MSHAPQTVTIVEVRVTTRILAVTEEWPEAARADRQKAREHVAYAVRNAGLENITIGASETESLITIDGIPLDEIGAGEEQE